MSDTVEMFEVCFVCNSLIGVRELPVWAKREGYEHIRTPNNYCSICQRVLDDGGTIFLEISGDFDENENIYPQHTRFIFLDEENTNRLIDHYKTKGGNLPDGDIKGSTVYVNSALFKQILGEDNEPDDDSDAGSADV